MTLGKAGRMVRCVKCATQWFASAPEMEDAAAEYGRGFRRIEPRFDDDPRFNSHPGPEHGDAAMESSAGWTDAAGGWSAMPPEPEDSSSRFMQRDDLVEFAPPDDVVTVDDAPATSPYDADEFAAGTSDAADADATPNSFESQRRRKARVKSKEKARGKLLTAPRLIAVMIGIIIGLLYERVNIVRLMPQTAPLYAALGMHINLRGLVFDNVRTVADVQDGVPVLIVEGAIRNITRDNVEVPRLRFAMRNTAGADIYAWTAVPEKPLLGAGQSLPFRTRLASPPAESRSAYVRFVQRRDIVAANP